MKYRLAIVDDDKNLLDSLNRYFSLRNYEVDAYLDSVAAFAGIKNRHHKIVLMDINMPKLDGLELMKRLKKHNNLIQVIIMTGNATAESVQFAIKEGASAYVVKPFDSLQMLEEKVEQAIEKFEKFVNRSRA